MIYGLTISLTILLPLFVAVWLRRRFSVRWWLFCVGMLTFVGSQIYHIPFNNWLTDWGVIGSIAPDAPNLLRTAVVLGLSAGLSESLARAIGYAVMFRRGKAQRHEEGIMVGLGHGGIEAMLLGGVLVAASLSSLMAMRGVDLTTLDLAPEQLAALQTQLTQFDTSSPLLAFVPMIERMIAMTLHVVLSVMVWQAFASRKPLWFVLAVAYHATVDATAVYVSQLTEQVWLIELALVVLLIPGAIWLWRTWPTTEPREQRPLRVEWSLWWTAVVHELRYQWASKRLLVVVAVFVLMGWGSPLLAKFTPEILKSVAGAEQFADLIPEPTKADALGQYIKNLSQFGFLLAILLGMGAVAGEKDKGTAAMMLSKPLPRWAFVLSKFTAQAAVYALSFLVAALGAYYYTLFLFEALDFWPFMLGNLLLLLWLLTFAAVTLLGSTLARSIGAAAGIAAIGAVLLMILGSFPTIGALMPGALMGMAAQLGLTAVTVNAGEIVMSGVLVLVLVVTAVAVVEVQEL